MGGGSSHSPGATDTTVSTMHPTNQLFNMMMGAQAAANTNGAVTSAPYVNFSSLNGYAAAPAAPAPTPSAPISAPVAPTASTMATPNATYAPAQTVNPVPSRSGAAPMTIQDQNASTLGSFLGNGGQDPSMATLAALNQFQQLQMPTIQNQAQLMGLGSSPYVMQATSMGLAGALTPLLQSDLQNKLAAVQANQQEESLNQSAAGLASQIANTDAQRQMSAYQNAGNLLLGGAANIYAPGTQLSQGQQQNALQAMGTGGQLQQDTAQNTADAQRNEYLRLQGLSEGGTTSLLGGFNPTQATETISKGGK